MKTSDGVEIVERWATEYEACGEKKCLICALIEELSRAEAQVAKLTTESASIKSKYEATMLANVRLQSENAQLKSPASRAEACLQYGNEESARKWFDSVIADRAGKEQGNGA